MAKSSLRIMSLNVENLFSPGNSFYGNEYDTDEYARKINWIADLITRAQVHIVGLTVLGEDPVKCLNDILAAIKTMDRTGWTDFKHNHHGKHSSSGAAIRNAIISRFNITKKSSLDRYPDGFKVDLYDPGSKKWEEVPSRGFSRPIAYCTITPPGNSIPLNVYIVHLKSKRPRLANHDQNNEAIGIARSAIQRNIEAAALRFYLDDFLVKQYDSDPDTATILMGDFNDTPTSVPVENIRGPFDKVPGPATNWSKADKKRLLNCARLHLKLSAHEDKLFSYIHNENFTLIDNIFVTEHLVSRFKHLEMYNDHVFRHATIRESTDLDKQWKSTVSDHGALVIELKNMLSD